MRSTAVLSLAAILVVSGLVLILLGLGSERNARRTLGAILLVLAIVASVGTLASTPAGAIGRDNGWTHRQNHNYPRDWPNPECQPTGGGEGCAGFSDDVGAGVPYPDVNVVIYVGGPVCCRGSTYDQDARNSYQNYIDPINRPGVGNLNSPWLWEGNRGGTVYVQGGNLGPILCGRSDPYFVAGAPYNHGCCQQKNLSGGIVWLNVNKLYRDDGVFGGNTYELRWTYNHEFSHAIGEGHTKYPDETMFPDNVPYYTAQTGDIVGFQCIYQGRSC
jgi:hypothetical protein